MGYRWLSVPLVGAFVLSTALASTAHAQEVVVRAQIGGYGAYNDNNYGDYAYQNGYRAGQREGERDARDRRDYGYKRDDAYEDADSGFRGGDKGRYRRDFRRGYEAGYDNGYRRYARDGWNNGGWNNDGRNGGGWYETRPTYPANPNYGGGGYINVRIAYDNGYRDGVEEGRKDFRRDRPFEPFQRDRYREADHGYDRSCGPKDVYRNDYRIGFRAGYDEGYRSAQRYDRRW
jgi:hypothetical protein